MGTNRPHPDHPVFLIALRSTLLLLIVLAIISTNIINIYVLHNLDDLQIFFRIMLINLSIAGLINGFFVCLPGFVASVADDWPLGNVYCQISSVLNGSSCAVTVWCLSIISLDRYVAIHYPIFYRNSNKLRLAIFMVAVFWIVAILTNSVPLMVEKQFFGVHMHMFMCSMLREWKLLSDVVYYVVYFPGAIIVFFSYCKIMRTLNQIDDREFNRKGQLEYTRNEKAMRILLISSIGYFVCWGPCTVTGFLVSSNIISKVPEKMEFVIIWLANSNSFMNVLIYSGCSDDFRRHLKNCVRRCFQKTASKPQTVSEQTSLTSPSTNMFTTN